MAPPTNLLIVFLLVWLDIEALENKNDHHFNYKVSGMPEKEYYEEGDLMLGGLFPVYGYSRDEPCGKSLRSTSILQYIEAMVFAIKEVNKDNSILPGIKMGFAILDTCVKESTALAQTLKFLPRQLRRGINDIEQSCNEKKMEKVTVDQPDAMTDKDQTARTYDVMGIVGAMKSSCSAQVATLCMPYRLPQISYSSTSDKLSDKSNFPYFMRLVPPDRFQVRAMLDFILAFNWSYISFIHDSGTYGATAYVNYLAVVKEKSYSICVAYRGVIDEATTHEQYDRVISNLAENRKAKVVVVFAGPAPVKRLFEAVDRAGEQDTFIWLGSDAWAIGLNQLGSAKHIARGAFTFKLHFNHVEKFHQYFQKLKPTNSTGNPWFREFWSEHFKCNWNDSEGGHIKGAPLCSNDDVVSVTNGYKPLSTIASVLDSVYTYAQAADILLKTDCSGNNSMTYIKKCIASHLLLETLKSTRFTGHSGEVSFDDNGDMLGRYRIEQFQEIDGEMVQKPIATWDAKKGGIQLDTNSLVQWYQQNKSAGIWNYISSNTSTYSSVPKSVCSKVCKKGQYRTQTGLSCCWLCHSCRSNEILTSKNNSCEECPPFTWPDTDLRSCEQVPPSHIEWSDTGGVLLTLAAVLGLVTSSVCLALFLRYRKEKLIKASSREISVIMLMGIIVGYSTVFGLVSEPRQDVCTAVHFSFGLCFSWIYAPLLTRTIRIFRIFSNGKKSKKAPFLVGPRAQVVICLGLISFQVVISLVSMILFPTRAELIQPAPNSPLVYIICNIRMETMVMFLAYNLLLICACTVYAFKTRKLPDNFNESRFISLCVYTTLVLWGAFIPAYFTVSSGRHKVLLLSLVLLLNGTVALILLFISKLYALLCVEEGTMNVNDGVILNAHVPTDAQMPATSSARSRMPPTGERALKRDNALTVVLPMKNNNCDVPEEASKV